MTLTEAQAITPEERRVKLAELMGYKPHEGFEGERWVTPDGRMSVTLGGAYEKLPDYCNDLNAVHEVERGLYEDDSKHPLVTRYETYLCDQVTWPLHATADQRTTALILTLSQP